MINIPIKKLSNKSFKNRLSIGLDAFRVGLYREYLSTYDDWIICEVIFDVSLTESFSLGATHCWYDGPNCALNLGFLHFNWSGNPFTGACKKCLK